MRIGLRRLKRGLRRQKPCGMGTSLPSEQLAIPGGDAKSVRAATKLVTRELNSDFGEQAAPALFRSIPVAALKDESTKRRHVNRKSRRPPARLRMMFCCRSPGPISPPKLRNNRFVSPRNA